MQRKTKKSLFPAKWEKLHGYFQEELPHVRAWLDDRDGFVELRLKAREDGTILAIAKGYDSDGGPIVCFGVGYDAVSCLMAIDGTINAGSWRFDKPWSKNGK